MKILIDDSISFIKGVFEPFAEVEYLDRSCIDRDALKGVCALIVRSYTHCNEALLAGTDVKIIATASVGTDHIDLKYCADHGIFVQNAAGCNAGGVMNYVFSALYGIAARKGLDLSGASFGIIGMGASGSLVSRTARKLGFNVYSCDPPRKEDERNTDFCSLDELLENSDIVSLHLPLTADTSGMVDEDFLLKMKTGAVFINAARGEIVNEKALIEASPKFNAVIIDTWNREPDINLDLLKVTDIATPHIAGYSYQGKQLATSMVVRSVARYFGIKELFDFFPEPEQQSLAAVRLDIIGKGQGEIASAMQYNYPIFTDDFMLRINPGDFARLRSEYHFRREFYID